MTPALKRDVLQWDVSTFDKALCFWEEHVAWDHVEKCLELGSREGGLSLWLALKGKNVICSDVAESQKLAEPLHKKHHVSHLMHYEDISATAIPYKDELDLIVFKSVLGGIGYGNNKAQQELAIAEMYKALKPGGYLLFAENLKASRLHRWFRKRFTNWGDKWRYPTLTEMEAMLADFQRVEYKTTGFLATFGRSEQQRRALALADQSIFNTVVTKNAQYVMYGVAQK